MRGFAAISLAWFFFMGGLGLFMPFYSLFLDENLALSGSQVGLVLSVQPLIAMLAQPFWGNVADRTGSRARIFVLLALGAGSSYALIGSASGFASVALATALMACFAPPLMPNAVAVTLAVSEHLDKVGKLSRHAFGLARSCGTVGFFAMVVSCPLLIDWIEGARQLEPVPGGPSEPALGSVFLIAGGLYVTAALVGLALPREGSLALTAPRGDWRGLFRNGPYLRLLLFAFIAYLTIQGPMGFFPIYIRAQQGSLATVSQLWIPMLLLEIPLIAFSGLLVERMGARGMLAMGIIAGGLRWTICGLFPPAPGTWWIHAVQLLHGVTVAGLMVGGPLYVEATVPQHLRNTAQSLLAMLGIALGGAVSNLITGFLVERVSTTAPYVCGGVAGLMLAASLPWLLPAPARPHPGPRDSAQPGSSPRSSAR